MDLRVGTVVVDMLAIDTDRAVDVLADCLRRLWHSMERGDGLLCNLEHFI